MRIIIIIINIKHRQNSVVSEPTRQSVAYRGWAVQLLLLLHSGMGGESSSQHGVSLESQIKVHWAGTVARCRFIPDSICLHGREWSHTGCAAHHLRDLDLPTILARMADRSELYIECY